MIKELYEEYKELDKFLNTNDDKIKKRMSEVELKLYYALRGKFFLLRENIALICHIDESFSFEEVELIND